MHIVSTFDELKSALNGRKSCITIGVFDGVHLGHQSLVNQTVQVAQNSNLVSVVISFKRHPLSVLAPPYTPRRLITNNRKANLLNELSVDIFLELDFTPEFAAISPEKFVRELLSNKANLAHFVCGYDFTFGKCGAGNINLLSVLSVECGFHIESLPVIKYNDMAVKSTHIRDLLFAGQLDDANALLSRPHEVPGTVVSGRKLGRTIGYPTANLDPLPNYQIPAQGVYLCAARLGTEKSARAAMVNVGTSPTFGENPQTVEAYILDFNFDIHGENLFLYFLAKLRNEMRFPSVPDLIAQLDKDRVLVNQMWETVDIQNHLKLLQPPIALHPS